MTNRFSSINQPANCRQCGKRTVSSIDRDLDIQLCRKCYDLANLENECLDRHHELKPGCTFCDEKRRVYSEDES